MIFSQRKADIFFVKQILKNGNLSVRKINGKENIADIETKALGREEFSKHSEKFYDHNLLDDFLRRCVDLQLVRQKDISLRSIVNACSAVLKDFKEDDLEVGTDQGFSEMISDFRRWKLFPRNHGF